MQSQSKSSKLKSWIRKFPRHRKPHLSSPSSVQIQREAQARNEGEAAPGEPTKRKLESEKRHPPSTRSARVEHEAQEGNNGGAAPVETTKQNSESTAITAPANEQNATEERRLSQASITSSEDDAASDSDELQTSNGLSMYGALDEDRDFRVLDILPARKASSQLRCRLKTANLDTRNLGFSALSYSWGSPDTAHSVMCNGRDLKVTLNLHAALVRLRERRKVVTIWADQICVNQSDISERNRQVRIMRDIYARAEHVLIWLGGDDPAPDGPLKRDEISLRMAVRRIRELSEEHRREDYGALQLTHYDYHSGEPQYGLTTEGFTGEYYHWHKKNIMSPAGDPGWEVLQLFFSRPWFTRIWVVQELAMARSVKVLCGDDELSWDEVKNAASYIDIHEYGEVMNSAMAWGSRFPRLLEESAIPTSGCLAMSSIRNEAKRTRQTHNEARCDLLKLLEATRPAQATDIRDKVIALLGLCGDISIIPDYNTSSASLFQTTATELIRVNGNLNILSQVFHSQSSANPNLPSWVPDFADFTRPPTLLSPRSHAAPPSSSSAPSFPAPGALLLPRVWRVARVSDVSPVLDTSHFDIYNDAAAEELFGIFKTMVRPLKRYRNDDTVNKAFFHSLVGGYIEFTPWAPGGRAQSLEALHHDYSHFYLRLVDYVTGMSVLPWNHRSAETYAKTAREKARRRRVVVTEELPMQKGDDPARRSQKLLGLGPEVAEVGDWIVVAEGGCVPLVVRKCENDESAWRLVGECYVHGIMDGEVAKLEGIGVGPMMLV
ncbi:hypothetical protein OQA88_6091 [Cercophora sp. LCS_1]